MKPYHGQVGVAVLMPHAPVLVPAVGGRRGNRAAASVQAMTEAGRRVVDARPDTVVLVSPHTPRRRGAFALWMGPRHQGTLSRFGAPEVGVDLPNDAVMAHSLMEEAGRRSVRCWRLHEAELDHGALVPLWHLAEAGWRGPTVLLGLDYPGEPGLVELGEAIVAAAGATGRQVALVASGDMSHCLLPGAPAGYDPRAQQFDAAFIAVLQSGDYRRLLDLDPELQALAAEDAVESTVIAAAAVEWDATGHEVLSYEGPFGVGYGVAILRELPATASVNPGARAAAEADEWAGGEALPHLARRSLEAAFRGEENLRELHPTGILGAHYGVFVTIRGPGGKLRGCVGTLSPRWPTVAEETWHMARAAAFRDGRFAPLTPRELGESSFEVSVILPGESVNSSTELDPAHYGVVVSTPDGRRGALLPGIDAVDTVEQQIQIARRKAGIGEGEPVALERFTVRKFRELHARPGRIS